MGIEKHLRLIIWLTVLLLSLAAVIGAQESTDGPAAVYLLPIEGAIEPGLAEFVARVLREAEADDAVVLIEINTFGGRVDAATEIRDLIGRMNSPVIAFVRDRAWSAGALITLAAPNVAMAPGSSIGAAEPQPMDEKAVSALRAEFEATAARHGRDPGIAGAMVDADVAIDGIIEEGKILTLSADRAAELGFTDTIARTRTEVLDFFGYADLPVVEFEPNWAERIARMITEPTISSLLLTIGFLGLLAEITSPGWGVPGTAGILALILFFGGRLVTGLAGMEVIILFLAGLVLIGLEVFVIPGFGVAGVLGISGIFISILRSFASIEAALYSMLFALAGSIVFVVVFWGRFSRSGPWKRLVLGTSEHKDLGYMGPKTYVDLVGKVGQTITPLRPSGTAVIDGDRYDVVSEGGFLSANVSVKVVKIEGSRVVVREVIESDA